MTGYDAASGTYFCELCGLHYKSKNLAGKCQEWCSYHNSCNLEIARQSVEAIAARMKNNR